MLTGFDGKVIILEEGLMEIMQIQEFFGER